MRIAQEARRAREVQSLNRGNASDFRVVQFAGAPARRNRRSRYHPSPAVTMVAPAPIRLDGTPTIRTSRCPGSSTAVPGTNGARKKGPQSESQKVGQSAGNVRQTMVYSREEIYSPSGKERVMTQASYNDIA